jgi:hypothetical protein
LNLAKLAIGVNYFVRVPRPLLRRDLGSNTRTRLVFAEPAPFTQAFKYHILRRDSDPNYIHKVCPPRFDEHSGLQYHRSDPISFQVINFFPDHGAHAGVNDFVQTFKSLAISKDDVTEFFSVYFVLLLEDTITEGIN